MSKLSSKNIELGEQQLYDSNSPSSKGCIMSDEDNEIHKMNSSIEKVFKKVCF